MSPTAKGVQKQPVHVHCGSCRHEWVCAYLPLRLNIAAKLMKTPCPMCGASDVRVGEIPRAVKDGDAVGWLVSGDTGTSSRTIWRVMMDRPPLDWEWHPSDPSDFGRCYRLLKVMPTWRSRLDEMKPLSAVWAALVDHWDELTALYEEELKNEDGMAPRLYARMKELGR